MKQFNEPTPGERVLLGRILEPVAKHTVAAPLGVVIVLCPYRGYLGTRNAKSAPNLFPFITDGINYSEPTTFTSFFPLDQRQVTTGRLLS